MVRCPARRPDFLRGFEIARVTRAGAFVITLHGGAVARKHRHADAVARAGISAEEPFAGGERNRAAAEACAAAFRVGDAGNGHRRTFDGACAFDQKIGRRLERVFDVEFGKAFRKTVRRREPCIFVFRREFRHRHRALGQFCQSAL